MRLALAAAAAAAAALLAAPAQACPDWEAAPYFGQIDLSPGFEPDPYTRDITAGGTHSLADCFPNGEAGFVTAAPDFDLYWTGTAAQVTIAIEAEADAILLVNTPGGEWYYNDDYRGSNPAITFYDPEEGLYDIWIGTYDGSRKNPARLVITAADY